MRQDTPNDLASDTKCPGCGRADIHKLCPAWGTKYYGTGVLLTPELEEETRDEHEKAVAESFASDIDLLT